jgi:hypothetical protein
MTVGRNGIFDVGGPQFGLADGKIAKRLADGIYDTNYDIPSIRLGQVSPQTTSSDLEGDDGITATASRTNKAEVSVDFGGVDTDVLRVIMGESLNSGQSTSIMYKRVRITNRKRPYFGLTVRAEAEEGNGDTHVFVPKAKVTGSFDVKFEYGAFAVTQLKITAVLDAGYPDAEGKPTLFEVLEHDTAVAATVPAA